MRVGICGAGIGGLMAAICLSEAGVDVTVLEAAKELGEIGAGIQMTPNVARLLRKYGVDKVIGNDLVRFEELNMRRKDGTLVGHAPLSRVEGALNQPWWLVHRHHLHNGLAEAARRRGCKLRVACRVTNIDYEQSAQVKVATEAGTSFTFDLLIGSDGVGSVVRRTLFPDVQPAPPSNNCAYRAIVPYAEIREHPELRPLVERPTMEVWMGPKAYIISYPISNGRDFNMVLSHHVEAPVSSTQDVDIKELRRQYEGWDWRIKKIVDMIPTAQRWPLLVTGPLPSWSSMRKNIVLMGDAAHSMVNHMAQGAATSMEDGAYLAKCLHEVVQNKLSLQDAIDIYEKGRMPKAHIKQQVSFLNGDMWMYEDGPKQQARDKAMEPELRQEPIMRSPNLYSDPTTVLEIYGYDAEAHAEDDIASFRNQGRRPYDGRTGVTEEQAAKYVNWFLPEAQRFQVKSHL